MNLREEIAIEMYNALGNAHLTWETCTVRGKYRTLAESILTRVAAAVEKVENPYVPFTAESRIYKQARQAIITVLEEAGDELAI